MTDFPERAAPDSEACGDLAGKIVAGDRKAEEELVASFRRGVSAIICRAGVDHAGVEDLVQETFSVAIARIRDGALRDPARLAGFVASVARNLALESLRRMGKREAMEKPGDGQAAAMPSGAAGALDGLLEQENAELVRRVLDELGVERDREVLRRVYLAGDDRDQICEDLGLTRLQLTRVVFRARERYRALYEEAVKKSMR